MVTASVPGIDDRKLEEFCRRWKVAELCLFGSGARGELRPDSDLDFMVKFQGGEHWNLLDLARMQRELAELAGRPVDIIEEGTVDNPYRLRSIARDQRVVYTA